MLRSQIHFPPRHEALREDVHALGAIVGEILREQGGAELIDMVEQDRVFAIASREGDARAGHELKTRVQGLAPPLARDLVRAFSSWFQAVNLAERVHRIRRRREYLLEDGEKPQPRGVEAALVALKRQGLSLDDVLGLLGRLSIEPVFTAHPTESTRRTILRKHQHLARLLVGRLDPTLTPNEKRSLWGAIRSELTAGWQTEDHPREKLTVSDEREHVLFYLTEVLYRVVPTFYDEIAQGLEKLYGVPADNIELPSLLHFGTWVGGDMDGHPDVHAKSIRDTLARQQQVIVNTYFGECQKLAERLSQSASRIGVLPALTQRVEEYMTLMPGARTITPARHDRMPYRVFLGQIGQRLRHTYEGRPNGYQTPHQFRGDIQLISESLRTHKGRNAGHFAVRRLLRRIDTFGFHVASLDIRQHTSVHHDVVALGLDDDRWLERTSDDRTALLSDAIARDAGPRRDLSALGKRTLAVFDAMMQGRHRYGPRAVGYFVVSGANGADDVLAALLLARWAEVFDKKSGEISLDLAPMFDSIASLEHSGDVMRRLLADPVYQRHLEARGRRQCVLIGYSDSNKDGGICASRFATHEAQRTLSQALGEAGERHVICHARGGSIARGGGRIDAIVNAAPDEAVNGLLRLTEQGEGLQQSYGLRPIAMRTLERALSALSLRTATPVQAAAGHEKYVEQARVLADASREAYRALVFSGLEFHQYFRLATPIDVIERMQIGLRPIHRGPIETVESMRAVPWVFAWTQTRQMLPGWFGAGTGIACAARAYGMPALRGMYENWYFLRNLIDDVETMMARADLDIAAAYEELVPQGLRRYGGEIRAEFALAREQILALKGGESLLDSDPTLQRAIQLRNPYVDPMNLMQVDLLRRWRSTQRQDRDLFDALLASISGIAQGLQSTG